MDLLKSIIGLNKTTDLCFLCFKNDKNNVGIHEVFEIRNNRGAVYLSLADMLKSWFPKGDFIFMQACKDCADLINELYILIFNRESKILLLDYMVTQLVAQTDTSVNSEINDKIVLNLQVPTNHDLNHKDNGNKETKCNFTTHLLNDNNSYETITLDTDGSVGKTCHYCLEKFQKTDELKTHLKIHRKKRQRRRIYHLCNDCNYKTLSKTTLQAHINKNHLNTRPHVCQICYKGFYNRSNLNEHVKTHNSKRNHICEQCGCSFIHKKNLIEHLRLHSDTRPYKCDICNKSYITSGRRSDHMKRSHMEKTECCLLCNKRYSLKKELTRHMNNVHLKSI